MIVADTSYLPLLLGHPPVAIPDDPITNLPIEDLDERIDLLIETLEDDKETILVPQPAFSEFLVLADKDGPKYISKVERSPLFKWGDFNLKAAIELASLTRQRLDALSKKALKRQTPAETKAKVSFDRQIVAIAKANGAHTIYSNDEGIKRFAEQYGIKVIAMWELPRPVESNQPSLFASEIAKAAIEGGPSESGS